jgi:hypothetical protein
MILHTGDALAFHFGGRRGLKGKEVRFIRTAAPGKDTKESRKWYFALSETELTKHLGNDDTTT